MVSNVGCNVINNTVSVSCAQKACFNEKSHFRYFTSSISAEQTNRRNKKEILTVIQFLVYSPALPLFRFRVRKRNKALTGPTFKLRVTNERARFYFIFARLFPL